MMGERDGLNFTAWIMSILFIYIQSKKDNSLLATNKTSVKTKGIQDMPKKTNFETNGYRYFRVSATIGKNTNSESIRKTFYGLSKSEAEAKRDEYLGNLKNGLDTNYAEMTIVKLMKIWLHTVVKIDRYRCFHNIRHRYATKLFEKREQLITISRLLGHADVNITAQIYITVMPKEKMNAAEKLNYLFE